MQLPKQVDDAGGIALIRILRNAGMPMASATDCNSGTSPMTSLLLIMNMSSAIFR